MTVFLIAAISMDGCIGGSSTHRSFEWTSQEDKRFYVDSIKRAKHVVMGSTTFGTFSKFPRGLTFYIYTSKPNEFINPKPEIITTQPTNESPQELVKRLEAEGVEELAICGGSSIYTQFMKAGVVNKLYLSVEPVIFGQGVKLFNDALDVKLQLVSQQKLGEQTLLLEYDVV
ncbi:MAG TPA: dihydrofolate reductase family protein [Vitreimonas sp.]|nr:dihydrofolate reductase family protein [Vitreimonas sp.]